MKLNNFQQSSERYLKHPRFNPNRGTAVKFGLGNCFACYKTPSSTTIVKIIAYQGHHLINAVAKRNNRQRWWHPNKKAESGVLSFKSF